MFEAPESFAGVPHGMPGPGCRAAILGIPFDCGTHPFRVGARQGPTEVRRQSRLVPRHHPSLADCDIPARLGLVDCGNVALVPGRIEDALPLIEAAAGAVLDAGAVPIGIGGDGSVSLPLMRAAAKRHPGLVALHVDSHTDAYPYAPEAPYNAATQFTHAAEEGLLAPGLSWHLGVRGFASVAGVLPQAGSLGFRVVTTEDLLRRGFAQAVAEFRDAAADRPVYLCWDMDVFDPSVAPGVCTPTWGGLTAREGIALMRTLTGLNIVAMDFNTVSPPQDVQGMAAHLCAHMIMEALMLLP
ncbi:arginase family protein [Paracraurococcus ruber]|uniref:Agmatinase n=1 Tax=Paracraurococcus ruber TaxID=77675 RepID=A0ABS1CR18_9PROT|nr:arginase family protein [Paracraurococcus ruber]MBK1656737.1 agmatinase [Paracraurococcus ruber]TDG30124.1 agmatinase [Paracraurococcus ruber]